MTPQTIIFIGPQGSGKGTQVRKITQYLEVHGSQKVFNLETGKAFRTLTAGDTYTGKRVKELIEDGNMVPNFITKSFVINMLIPELGIDTHLTMDGFPRNATQVKFIDDLMEFYKRPLLTVVHLHTPEAVVRDRMESRGRSDDTKEAIEVRLRLYREQTAPIVEIYRDRGDVNFIEVDGTQTIETVTQGIIDGLQTT